MWSILWSALALTAAGAPVVAGGEVEDPKQAPCCFTNPRYSGVCSVEPAADESCGQILDFLNSPQSQGKSYYCGNTNVRGGWSSQKCEPEPLPES